MTNKRAFRQNWRNAGTQFERRNAGSYDIGHWQRRKIVVYEARPLWVLSSRNLNLDNVIKKYRSFKCTLIQWCKELEQLRTSKALTLAWKLKLLIGVLLWIWFSSINLVFLCKPGRKPRLLEHLSRCWEPVFCLSFLHHHGKRNHALVYVEGILLYTETNSPKKSLFMILWRRLSV